MMDAILATIAKEGQAIVDINRVVSRNNFISCLLYNFILNPSTAALANPFCRVSWCWGVFLYRNSAAGEANGSIMVKMFACCEFC